MKLLRSVFLVSSLFSLSLFAQHGGGGHGGGGGGFHGGGGGGAFRGGGGGAFRGGGGYYGGFRGGYGGYRGFYGGYGLGFGLGYGWGGWGWGNPYYYGYYGYPYYDPYYYGGYYGYPQAYTYSTPAAPAAPAAPATTSYYRTPDYYLIAFNDHTIRAAASYQVVGDQIEWTPKEGGAVQRAPLASVDKTFTTQVNRDRRVKIDLP